MTISSPRRVFKGSEPPSAAYPCSQYKTNALGVIHSIQAFLPILRAGNMKRIIVISSASVDPKFIRGASLTYMPAYAMTKAAALIVTTNYALKLAREGFIVISLSPGLADVSRTVGDNGEQKEAANRENNLTSTLRELGISRVGRAIGCNFR